MSTATLIGWFDSEVKPRRIGVYRRRICEAGWSYSMWNGRHWERFGRWGHYDGAEWCGLNMRTTAEAWTVEQ